MGTMREYQLCKLDLEGKKDTLEKKPQYQATFYCGIHMSMKSPGVQQNVK